MILNGPAQVLFSNIDYDEYVGRIGIGRVERGSVKVNDNMVPLPSATARTKNVKHYASCISLKASSAWKQRAHELGDIVAVSGIADLNIGETACRPRLRGAAALCQDRRADGFHDVHGQQQPRLRAVRANM